MGAEWGYTSIADSNSEGILKISQHLLKPWARIKCPVFDSTGISYTRFTHLTHTSTVFQ